MNINGNVDAFNGNLGPVDGNLGTKNIYYFIISRTVREASQKKKKFKM